MPVGHAFAVEAVAGFALRIQPHHGQRSGFQNRARVGLLHLRFLQAFGQHLPESVARQGVEIEHPHALQPHRARQVVDGAARTRAQAAVGFFDHVDQGLAGGGDLNGLVRTRENHK